MTTSALSRRNGLSFETGAESAVVRRFLLDRSWQILDAAHGSQSSIMDEESARRDFVIISIARRRMTKARFLKSDGEISFTGHRSDLQPQIIIRFSNSPPIGEAGRSAILPME